MKLFDFSLQFNGFKIHKAEKLLASIQNKNEKEFQVYLAEKKKGILDFHLFNNPFYKELVSSKDVSNWEDIPILTKKDLQQPLNQRLSDGFSAKNVYINKTSGSSGDPFIFAKDKWCHAMTWAVIKNRFSWYGIDFNSTKQARFFGIPLDKKSFYKEQLKDWFSNRFRFSVFDLSDSSFKHCLLVFSKTKFEFINGYTSPIVQFAKYLKRNRVVLKSICPTLEVCIVTSEMLFENDKKLMEDYFGVPVVNEYGASELDLIAFQDPKGHFRLNSETLYVEIVNDKGNTLPNGEEGRIVITSLYNKAHPFIRYDIGDIGVISVNSTCKRPILKTLVGRTNDVAVLPSGKKAAGLTFYYITKSIIEDDGVVKEFIIKQLEVDHFKVSYVSSGELSIDKIEAIKNAMTTYLEEGIKITFERRDKLIRSKSGKLKQFVSKLQYQTSSQ